MLKINNPANIDPTVQLKLDAYAVADRPYKFDKSKAQAVVNFRNTVMTHGLSVQGDRCAWCTLMVGKLGRRTAHRDHIAPKKVYPQWTFHAKNLIVVCEYCNGFSVKHTLDTVDVVNVNYDQSTFKIVHPYIDNPSLHIQFIEVTGNTPGVVIEGITLKGTWTIDNLKLADDGMTVLRAQDLIFYRNINMLPPYYQELLKKATGRE
ncbi:hypothetical protein H9T43_002439 [Salmonella enterica]|nr:hypothetical protein [Salmonella enterica]